MHGAQALSIKRFGNDSLSNLPESTQRDYLSYYLTDLGAQTVLEEPQYFDRDYLAEFSAFYSTSSKGYVNVCQRLHFFSKAFSRRTLVSALRGNKRSLARLKSSYLGFTVLRPIHSAPFGRTVLKWYPETKPNTPRITNPSRTYKVHLAGIELSVSGLAWQQQDSAVGACATVGLWTMLHSSAFDDHHAIPTTAEITKSAHRTASLGNRIFPSNGLTPQQLAEAIKEQNLAPIVVDGDLSDPSITTPFRGFTADRFSSFCAAFTRSGYPVLIIGQLGNAGLHAVVAVGFRETPCTGAPTGTVGIQDGNTEFLYLHDDNLGPGVRFRIEKISAHGPVRLVTDPPPPRFSQRASEPTAGYGPFIPLQLVIAVHDDVRLSPDELHTIGLKRALRLAQRLKTLLQSAGKPLIGLWLSVRTLKLHEYLSDELQRAIPDPKTLARTRLALVERVPPMCLHLGVIRIALDGAIPLVDVLIDTTEGPNNNPVYAHVPYYDSVAALIGYLLDAEELFGLAIPAYA